MLALQCWQFTSACALGAGSGPVDLRYADPADDTVSVGATLVQNFTHFFSHYLRTST